MHGIPSIGVNMHIDGTEEWEDEEADIIRGNCIDVGDRFKFCVNVKN